MNPKESDIQLVQEVLMKLVVEDAERLAEGKRRRAAMYEKLAESKASVKNNYRYRWLQSSAAKVVSLMNKIALDFNVQHADDMASIQDMCDILATAEKHLKK